MLSEKDSKGCNTAIAIRRDIDESTQLRHEHIFSFHSPYFCIDAADLNFVDNNLYMYNVLMSFTYVTENLSWSSATVKQGSKRRIHDFSLLDSVNQAVEKFLIVLNCLELHAMCMLSHYLSFSMLWNLHVLVMAEGHTVRTRPCAGIYLMWDKVVKAKQYTRDHTS